MRGGLGKTGQWVLQVILEARGSGVIQMLYRCFGLTIGSDYALYIPESKEKRFFLKNFIAKKWQMFEGISMFNLI